MLAFQKYCQVHQIKMLLFTSFLGLMTFFMFLMSIITVIKKGLAEALNDPITMAGFVDFPASFLLILLLHKIYNLYIQGHFFTSHTLKVLQTIAKLAILLGMVLKPGIELSLLYFTTDHGLSIVNYLGYVDFPIAIVGYVLHIGTAAHKISRDIEQEQELTV